MNKRALAVGPVRGTHAALRGAARMVVWLLEAATVLIERHRQRHSLAALDDRLLRDVGLSRVDVSRECEKPFWRD
jgi:Uncharacterized conserved small protein